MSIKKKFVAVGTGGRIPMFINPIVRDYSESCELLGLCDISQTRMEFHRDRLKQLGQQSEPKLYPAADFDRMLQELKPDVVIVCTMDSLHHEYVIRAVEFGADVICEKPLTTDDEKCRNILDAIRRTGRKVRVTFNYRWSPGVTKVRELLQSGAIGNIKHVNLEYLLDTKHGADYFRRWHSNKKNSGGLLVHKSTHHFDLVNWWVNSIPKTVYGIGDLVFYGRENALARGDEKLTRYDRYTGEGDPSDPFYLSLTKDETTKGLYLNAEKDSGYIRDQNVFREGIDIEDSMSVIVRYRNGVMFNYSLNAYCPWEGFRASITGDKGRIEYEEIHTPHLITGQDDEKLGKEQAGHSKKLTVMPLFEPAYSVEIPVLEGGHGGGDPLIQEQMFSEHPRQDPFERSAGAEQGVASAIIGIAANKSIATGEVIDVDKLVTLPDTTRLGDLN